MAPGSPPDDPVGGLVRCVIPPQMLQSGAWGGPSHAPDCDGRCACMLQLKRTQKKKDGQEVKHQDHIRCTITCGYCGKRNHYEDECRIKRCESEKLKKAEEERRKNAGKGSKPKGGSPSPGGCKGKGNPGGRRRFLAPPLVQEEHPTPHLRVSKRVKNSLSPQASALVAATTAARTPRRAASTGTLSACRPLVLK